MIPTFSFYNPLHIYDGFKVYRGVTIEELRGYVVQKVLKRPEVSLITKEYFGAGL